MGPFRLFEAKVQSPDQGFKALHESGQGNRTDLSFPDSGCPGGEISLAQGMQMDVGGKARPQPGPKGKEPARQARWDPVDKNPGQLVELEILVGHQEQRVEKMLAELPIGHPGFQLEFLEGQRVDEKGLPVDELDVEGAGILQGHPEIKGRFLDLEQGQSRLFELRETPLIRIGDEGDELGLYDLIGQLRVGRRNVDFIMGDQESPLRQDLVEAAGKKLVIRVFIDAVDLPVECALPIE
jgi:hypothetical protein